jgi:DHA2 family multidrug resistance protein
MQAPWLPEQWDILTNDGLAMLNAEVNRQALALGFMNDFTLIMIGSLISVPLVFLLARGRAVPGKPAADGRSK